MTRKQELFFVEMTDTFGGDANYSWVNRFKVKASTERGAIRKVAKQTGFSVRLQYFDGDLSMWTASGAAVCFFVSSFDKEMDSQYSRLIEL